MKKKLFAAAFSLIIYVLFVVALDVVDNHLDTLELSNRFAIGDSHFAAVGQGNLIDPAPEPPRPPMK